MKVTFLLADAGGAAIHHAWLPPQKRKICRHTHVIIWRSTVRIVIRRIAVVW